jgi:hypothetical protein
MDDQALTALFAAYLAGDRDEPLLAALAKALEDEGTRQAFARTQAIHRHLHQAGMRACDADFVMRVLPKGNGKEFQDRILTRLAKEYPSSRHVRSIARQPMAIAVVVLVAVLLGFAVVSQRAARAARSTPDHEHEQVHEVAHVTAVNQAVWSGMSPPAIGAGLAPGRLDLSSGFAAVSLASGAEVLLEGPASLELQTPMHARLIHGRVSVTVPMPAHGFTIAAEGLEVVDRGTEFGIEFMSDGHAVVEVFAGKVEAALLGDRRPYRGMVTADEAVRIDPARGTIDRIPSDPARFMRSLSPTRLALDCADLIAGGDGLGTGRSDGIDPRTGAFTTAPSAGVLSGDALYHRAQGGTPIDGVFIPADPPRETIIDSLGHRYAFPASNGKGFDLIRRGGILESPEFSSVTYHPVIVPVFGGIDYAQPGHSAIGMHANVGISIDLHAAARAHPGLHATRFTAQVANLGSTGPGSDGIADFWVFMDGRLRLHLAHVTASAGGRPVDLPVSPTDHILTLVSTDGGFSPTNWMDWITLGDAHVQLEHQAPSGS